MIMVAIVTIIIATPAIVIIVQKSVLLFFSSFFFLSTEVREKILKDFYIVKSFVQGEAVGENFVLFEIFYCNFSWIAKYTKLFTSKNEKL